MRNSSIIDPHPWQAPNVASAMMLNLGAGLFPKKELSNESREDFRAIDLNRMPAIGNFEGSATGYAGEQFFNMRGGPGSIQFAANDQGRGRDRRKP
jgi:hypothetical protein